MMPAERLQPTLYTYAEACERLTCGYSWLKDQVAKERITTVRLGRSVRFTQTALDEFIAALTKPARAAQRRSSIPSLAERKRSAGIS